MSGLKDLSGQRFGRLVVVERAGTSKNGAVRWRCQCDCGRETVVRGSELRSGHIQSCGCLSQELFRKRAVVRRTHGESKTRLYHIWTSMKYRCYNPNYKQFLDYGGRGITVCEEWRHDFQAFYDWAMNHGYRDDLSIDRIDNYGPYSSENCRWTDMRTQSNNRRNNHHITFRGETHTLSEWARKSGLKKYTILARLKRGWPIERALTEPVRKGRRPKKK